MTVHFDVLGDIDELEWAPQKERFDQWVSIVRNNNFFANFWHLTYIKTC